MGAALIRVTHEILPVPVMPAKGVTEAGKMSRLPGRSVRYLLPC